MSGSGAPSNNYGSEREFQIYLAGLQGQRPTLPLAFEALEAQARAKLPPEAFDYVAGSASGEDTARQNLAAFTRWRIVPRMLRNVSSRYLSVEVLGHRLPAPVMLAPVGVLGIVHPDAELAVARAAASLGIPFALSTVSSTPLERVAEASGSGQRWFQLYWGRDSELTASMLKRAEAAGFTTLIVTLDTHTLGWRERDLQNAYLPFLLGQGLANYFSDPVFRASLQQTPEQNPHAAIMRWVSVFSNPSLTWSDLVFLREHTRLPVLLKGILHPDDAQRALDAGVDGIIVSNHGGRQVDGAIAALDALPRVVEAVGGSAPVLFDSGIRRGSDVIKALALGARAVLLGRPYVYGLALAGEAGVREVTQNLLGDFDISLGLSGYASVEELSPETLVRG